MGKYTALEGRSSGFNWSFSPVADLSLPHGNMPAYTDDIGLTVYEEKLPAGIKSGGLFNPGLETGYAYPWLSLGADLEAGPAWAAEGS
jgi:hypothetical protein